MSSRFQVQLQLPQTLAHSAQCSPSAVTKQTCGVWGSAPPLRRQRRRRRARHRRDRRRRQTNLRGCGGGAPAKSPDGRRVSAAGAYLVIARYANHNTGASAGAPASFPRRARCQAFRRFPAAVMKSARRRRCLHSTRNITAAAHLCGARRGVCFFFTCEKKITRGLDFVMKSVYNVSVTDLVASITGEQK